MRRGSDPPVTDPPAPRWSCRFLESGLSFTPERINACSITHHGRGEAALGSAGAGPLPLDALEARRRQIIQENQAGRHPACQGCPLLTQQVWPERRYRFDWIGITHYTACNLTCSYCWLLWADYSPRRTRQPVQLYSITPFVRQLIDERLLDPRGEIDWGGGGEPTLMPEFNECFEALREYGVTQWLHTNAVRIPRSLQSAGAGPGRLKVICSVDAGTAATYRSLKLRDAFEQVWRNVDHYRRLGAEVRLKYIMLPDNCDDENISEFVTRAATLPGCTILSDVDYRNPVPDEAIMRGLLSLHTAAHAAGIHIRYGSTGEYSAVDQSTSTRIADRMRELQSAPASRPRPLWQSLAHDLG
jgi:pyruvate-formate lyase-activating enzyme